MCYLRLNLYLFLEKLVSLNGMFAQDLEGKDDCSCTLLLSCVYK